MKKLLGILVLGLLWCNVAFAESVYDFLKKEYEYSRSLNMMNIYAHNSHSNKTINIKKMEVMFSECGGLNWDNPDRVYSVNRKIYPQSDKHIMVDAHFPKSAKKRCIRLWAEFERTTTTTTTTTIKKKPEKSGAKKLLEKIIGD